MKIETRDLQIPRNLKIKSESKTELILKNFADGKPRTKHEIGYAIGAISELSAEYMVTGALNKLIQLNKCRIVDRFYYIIEDKNHG